MNLSRKIINIYDNEKQKFLILIYRFGSLLLQPYYLSGELKTIVKMNELVKKISS